MRVVTINSRSDLQALSARFGRDRADRTLVEIERLNPHVDFSRLATGTVLLVPDPPDEPEESIQGKAFADLREQVIGALDASSARVRRGYEALGEEAKEITAVLRTAAVRRAVEADPALQQQVDDAAAAFKRDAAEAKTADTSLRAIREQAAQELSALAKILE
jgi:hypothetical protein